MESIACVKCAARRKTAADGTKDTPMGRGAAAAAPHDVLIWAAPHLRRIFCDPAAQGLRICHCEAPTGPWRPEREARGSAPGVQSREGTAVLHPPLYGRGMPRPALHKRFEPAAVKTVRTNCVCSGSLRSRWRLCRLTDAASPLRGVSASYRIIQPRKGTGAPQRHPDVSLRGAKRRGNLAGPYWITGKFRRIR